MKKLPKKIQIGPIRYKVKYTNEINNTYDEDETLMGLIEYEKSKISISKNMNHDLEKVVVLHECIHGILDNAGQLAHDEGIVDLISHGIIDLLDRNPKLLEYLIQK